MVMIVKHAFGSVMAPEKQSDIRENIKNIN